jgi:hypothetical protein
MDRGAQRAEVEEAQQDKVDRQAADDQETEQATVAQEPESGPDQSVESAQEAEVQESAFDKTQRILDQLMGKEPEAPVAQEAASPELEETEPAVEQPSDALETSAEGAPVDPTPEIAPATSASVQTDAVQQAKGPEAWVSYNQFSKLSIEVTQLQRELRALREELQVLRIQEPSPEGAGQAASADASAGQVALPVAEESSEAVSMEEVA